MTDNLLCHMVAAFPQKKQDLEVAKNLIQGGAAALEIQFPFSDPYADGPLIQKACAIGLENRFTLAYGFDLIRTVTSTWNIPVYIMSYASPVYLFGCKNFAREAARAGAKGLIVPDLPFDCDEGLATACREYNIHSVPVLVSDMDKKRLENIMIMQPEMVYIALRRGITGIQSTITQEVEFFLQHVKSKNIAVMAGFGIQKTEQVKQLEKLVDYVIVGSALVDTVHKGDVADLKAQVRTLCGK